MKINYSERVKTFLSMLSGDEHDRVATWLHYLQDWDRDPFAKSQSVEMTVQGKPVYLFRTGTDLRILFTVDDQKQTIDILHITSRDTILSFGGVGA